MKVGIFSTKQYVRQFFDTANRHFGHELVYFESRLTADTVSLAEGFEAVCPFVNDKITEEVLHRLAQHGTRLIAMRSAGFNNVDIEAAARSGITVARVPAYSPNSVAEHTIALIMTLNRKVCRAFARVREGNFSLDGLLGFDLFAKTVGIVGTGRIGATVACILHGFGCHLLAHDVHHNPECEALGVRYVNLPTLFAESDVITLHCPLTRETWHMINDETLSLMKDGLMLINTSRGALIDTPAVIEAMKSGKIGYLGLDVYEEEEALFFEDLSSQVIQDDVFARLLWFPNAIITGHLAFFTSNALEKIAETTLNNVTQFEKTGTCDNIVSLEHLRREQATAK
jgi:D-lactate dehydrogenase